jgi:fibronectin-binding autotransporter adhesin
MYRRPLPIAEHACWFWSLALIICVAFASHLSAATVLTGDVFPPSPWGDLTYPYPQIGITDVGTLLIDGGSQRTSNSGMLGVDPGSTGAATITGPGSKWTNNQTLYIGNSGTGQLRVEAGGQVSNPVGYLGVNPGATGNATITGLASKWINSSALYVGPRGNGTVTVENGGHVSTGTLYASMADLHGDGTIAATGAVLDADLQFNSAQPAQAVLEFGAGGTLTVAAGAGNLGAGYKGLGSLTIAEGVAVSSFIGILGHYDGSTGNATITGLGSKWNNTAALYVGSRGSGALTVENGGHVSAGTLYASLTDLTATELLPRPARCSTWICSSTPRIQRRPSLDLAPAVRSR